jgi:hypothetical protein
MSALPSAAPGAHLQAAPAPRQFTRTPAVALVRSAMLMPQQRAQRLTDRRSFVEMKRQFIEAVSDVAGSRGEWLRRQVRQTEAPVDLWLLRGAVYSAINGDEALRCQRRLQLHQALDSVFPDSGFTPLPPR